jgi:hypothetical protein
MTNSILIGKVIYKLLREDQELQGYIGSRIFPLVAENDTIYPFITYSRESIFPSNLTKDGIHEDTCTFSILIVSSEYMETLEIANICRRIFEKRKINSDSMILSNVQMSDISEDYSDNAYTQKLVFTCKVINNE